MTMLVAGYQRLWFGLVWAGLVWMMRITMCYDNVSSRLLATLAHLLQALANRPSSPLGLSSDLLFLSSLFLSFSLSPQSKHFCNSSNITQQSYTKQTNWPIVKQTTGSNRPKKEEIKQKAHSQSESPTDLNVRPRGWGFPMGNLTNQRPSTSLQCIVAFDKQ